MPSLLVWKALTFLGGTGLLVPLSLIIILILYRQRRKRLIWLVALSFYGGILLNKMLKQLFHLPRPPGSYLTSYGFPSGHAMNAVIFYSLLVLLFAYYIKEKKWKYIFVGANVLAILLVGISRVMLGVHYVHDVVGGFVFGVGWLMTVRWIVKQRKK